MLKSITILTLSFSLICEGAFAFQQPQTTTTGTKTNAALAPGPVTTNPTSPNTTVAAQPVHKASGTVDSLPYVLNITVFHPSKSNDSTNTTIIKGSDTSVAYPGNIIKFKVVHAQNFLRSRQVDQSKVALYINGIEMEGITTDWCSAVTTMMIQQGHMPYMKDTMTISIPLVRNPASQSSWNFFYNNAKTFTSSYIDIKKKDVSIGWENMSALPVGPYKTAVFSIAFFYLWEFWMWTILFIGILVFFVWFASKTNILRTNSHGPYSLSNTQLLFWSTLVIGAFIYTLLLTDVTVSFNMSILYMIGISLGTTGIATAIDQHKISTQTVIFKGHSTFFKDILTDGDSYSVQRIQTFAWNLILGLYFVIFTIKNKTMPEFSSTMLLLAGFSSSAYLAGKVPENTAASQTAIVAQKAIVAQQNIQNQQGGDPQQPDATVISTPPKN